ncbi:MAG TPA: alkaline phosphatase family protein [Chloroflexota bacterium]|nr:alkaline phosphatase family protein [Chloroflexota bacterium]HUM68536.1 alkaline phosphatase family protein [Chloroflexota bacterium]
MNQLPDEFTWPAYDGRSIANIPATAAEILHVPFRGLLPLHADLWQPLASGAKRVVLLVLDAFGWNLLQAEAPNLERLVQKAGVVGQLTSIFPSTTVAALSSLWTGAAPAQHGMLGFTMFFPEFATATEMLRFTPVFAHHPDALVEAGLEPETFLHWPGLAEQLARYGVPTYSFKGREIVGSALSKMHTRGVAADLGSVTFADMLTQMGQLLHEKAGEPMFIFAYWPVIDTLSHFRLWDGAATRAEARMLFYQIEQEFLNRLTAVARQDTLLFVTADHGQVALPDYIFLEDHPRLQEMLFMRPTGEHRVSYLYAKHGRTEDILHYLHAHLGHALVAMRSAEALAAGLFGPPPHTAVALDRLGDVVVIMRSGYKLLIRAQEKKARLFIGGHGSMTHAEMQSPWLGFRLDGW